MRRKPEYFDLVREESRKLWDQLEANRQLSGPWWLLFKQIQDPRHVLSELLQNADDAGATEASVDIENSCIVFRHNGHDFSEEELRSLCQFGFSNKRRLLTIGFRGIGFKSVFSLGSAPQVLTPTLAFRFDLSRFTQPEWIDAEEVTDQTVVGVRFESPAKEKAIRAQIKNWTSSAVPLLFFQSIRTLRLLDRSIRVETEIPGPCPESRVVTLSGSSGVIQIFRSGEEEFPQECLDEVRAERNDEKIDLPPCEVVLLLGAGKQQRLFCVLPTDVTVELPFSCQAPFVQDPARSAIKDPSTSPTNAWLLDRIGRLAAESLLTWLNRDDLATVERAKAYDLLPELTSANSVLLSGIATQRILEAFRKCTEKQDLLLCAEGRLDNTHHTVYLPSAVIEVWGADDARAYFTPDKRSVIAKQVRSSARSRLESWKFLAPTSLETLWKVLADESELAPQRPAQMQALAAFWAFAQRNLPVDWAEGDWWRNAAIVPLSGRSCLGRAKDTLSSRDCPATCPPEDWQFVIERAEILDDDWVELLKRIKENRAEALRSLEEVLGRPFKDRDLGGVLDGYRRAKLDQAPTLDRVFEQVAPRIMGATEPALTDATRFLQIAAKLNVSFPESVQLRFLCEDGQWRQRTDGLLARSEIDLEKLLPAKWLSQHLISVSYEAGLTPPDTRAWRKWAGNPKKCGLTAFPLPVQSPDTCWFIDKEFFIAHGAAVPQKAYITKWISQIDLNSAKEILTYWCRQEDEGVADWVDIGLAVIASWSSNWDNLTRYEVRQFAYGRWQRLDKRDVPATWLFELRNHKSLPDSQGDARLPADLFRRTPDTLALLDVEPFILESWDLPEYARALDELGVRTQPTDASRLLDRLRALTLADSPPIGPLRDLYRAIERVLPRLPEDQKVKVCSAFAAESLIRSECAWARSGFCFRENPRSIPGVSVVHPDIRDRIGLWDVLKIPTEPSAPDALRWFESLPLDTTLSESDRSAARKILELYPSAVWGEKSRWINLQAQIARTGDLKWGCLDPRSVPGLFSSVRIGTADFSMMDGNRLQVLMVELPPLLDTVVERRVLEYQPGAGVATTEQSWLHALGRVLSLLCDGDAEESALASDRRAAQRMMGTRWVPAQSVRIQPFLDGEPVGTESELRVAWVLDSLYVQGDSIRVYKSLVREISRQFATTTALDTIRDCVGRDPAWIQAYADEHLQLSIQPPPEPPPPPIPAIEDPVSVFPPDSGLPPRGPTPPITVIKAPDPPGAPPTASPMPPGGGKPSPPKEPTKVERLERFLAGRGFERQAASETFVRPDGSFVQRIEGIFHWELSSGGRVTPLWLAATSLSAPNGIEVPAEVWLAGERDDAVLLAPDGDGYIELRFSSLRAQVDQLILELYPATFRIRVPDEA